MDKICCLWTTHHRGPHEYFLQHTDHRLQTRQLLNTHFPSIGITASLLIALYTLQAVGIRVLQRFDQLLVGQQRLCFACNINQWITLSQSELLISQLTYSICIENGPLDKLHKITLAIAFRQIRELCHIEIPLGRNVTA